MEEKVFIIDRAMTRRKMEDLVNINQAIEEALSNGNPVRAVIPYGTFTGTVARLKLGKRRPADVAKVFRRGSASYDPNLNTDLYWELEASGSNRNFSFSWSKAIRRYSKEYPVKVIIGGDGKTEIVRKEKNEATHLVDFMGQQIDEGDYVLMYNGPWELKNTGSPFRMLRYTGKRSQKQAQFTYVKLSSTEIKWSVDGGETIRVGLNSNGKDVTDVIYGVKVSVDESLATAMQMTDHDMSIYPITFHVGLVD